MPSHDSEINPFVRATRLLLCCTFSRPVEPTPKNPKDYALQVVVVVSFDYHLARDMRGHDHPLILAVERAISHSVTAAVIDYMG